MSDITLRDLVLRRLDADTKPEDEWSPLVVGRNGSSKSSFAEAPELLLTADTYRWAQRTKVWREGWRNLHHTPAAIEAELCVEGAKGAGLAARRWADDADLEDATTSFQIHGQPRKDLSALGWDAPLVTYRPFLSYNELGSLLDEGPSKLYDALAAILGLDALTEAQQTLQQATPWADRIGPSGKQRNSYTSLPHIRIQNASLDRSERHWDWI